MPRKVIIIGPAHPLRGGLATYNERLAREFATHGDDVEIYTFSLQYPDFLFPGTTQYSSEPTPNDLTIRVKINSINPLNWLSIGNEIKNKKPDVIVVRYWLPFMGPCLGTILRRVKKNKVTRIICIADNIVPHEKRPFDNAFTSYFIKPIDAFVTMSEAVLSDLRTITEKEGIFVPHPIYDTFGEAVSKTVAADFLKIDAQNRYVLFFGFIRKYKGLDWLFEAISWIKNNHPNLLDHWKFVIAGEYYEAAEIYTELITKLEIQEHLILKTDFITDSEVKYYFSLCDLVVQPYKSATQSGITPLAFFYNKPTLVTNVGGLANYVDHMKTGLIAEANPETIGKQLAYFFQKQQVDFSIHIQEEKKKYQWSHIMNTIVKLAEKKKL